MKENLQKKRRKECLRLMLLAQSFDEKSPFHKENLPYLIFWEIVLRTGLVWLDFRLASVYLYYYEREDILFLLFGFYGDRMTSSARYTQKVMGNIFECIGRDKKILSFVDEYMKLHPETKATLPALKSQKIERFMDMATYIIEGDYDRILIPTLNALTIDKESLIDCLTLAFTSDSKKCVGVLFPYIDYDSVDIKEIDGLLCKACQYQSEDIVGFFLEKRLKLKKSNIGSFPLSIAIHYRNISIIPILAKYGAELSMGIEFLGDNTGFYTYTKSLSTYKALYEYGLLDFEMKDRWGKTLLDAVKEKKENRLQEVLSWKVKMKFFPKKKSSDDPNPAPVKKNWFDFF
jgi:hypothetical protein